MEKILTRNLPASTALIYFRAMGRIPVKPAKRGVLKLVVRRTPMPDNPARSEVLLACGHTITRSDGQRPERCYCLECAAKVE